MNKEDFEVKALFYNSNNLKFRRYLEIKRKDSTENENDLTVIMMNPGSSKPKDINEETDNSFLDKFVVAHPDPTQYQIMKIMHNCNLNYAKIINLSDVRNGSSNNFYKMLSEELAGINHSIFDDSNDKYLNKYINLKSKFILGWGVNKKLSKLSDKALKKLEELNIDFVGLRHPNNKNGFYHPLPRTEKQQFEWVEKITEQLKNYG